MRSTRHRIDDIGHHISVAPADDSVELLRDVGVVATLSVAYMFCVSVLRTLTIRNAWNAIVPRVFGFREISRKEAAGLRALASALTYTYNLSQDASSGRDGDVSPSLGSSKLVRNLISGILIETTAFVVSVFSVRKARKVAQQDNTTN